MIKCKVCNNEIVNGAVKCRHCGNMIYPLQDMIMTASSEIEGYDIYEYYDVAYGETVVPNGLLGALTSGTFFTISALAEARRKSLDSIKSMARGMGANAVISWYCVKI